MRLTGFFGVSFTSLVCLWLLPAVFADIQDTLPPDIAADGWQEITFEGKPPNRYEACGSGCISIASNSSVSMIGRPVSVKLTETPTLNWEWKLTGPAPVSDLTVKGKDDRPAAVYVTFPFDPDTATFGERLMRPAIELVRGADAPGRMLSYVWGGNGLTGDVIESPYYGGVNAMIVLRNANEPVGDWVQERVNVLADHERVFNRTPNDVSHVLLSADSDDTQTRSLAFVRNLTFKAN